jgi:transcriptional regulator with XRE-family HTH domain
MTDVKDDTAHPIDAYVGGRIRLRRVQLGLSQTALGGRIGVSFQAVQKYESGDIRISASRLFETAQALQVAPGYFFEGFAGGKSHAESDIGRGPDQREIMSLIRGYYGIRDPGLQAEILRLIGRLGQRAAEPAPG